MQSRGRYHTGTVRGKMPLGLEGLLAYFLHWPCGAACLLGLTNDYGPSGVSLVFPELPVYGSKTVQYCT